MASEAPRKTGKWLRDDVPHSGWTCAEVVEGGPLCDMCEVTHIVYAHVMTHLQYPGFLECGYVCAGFMTDSPAVELVRELLFKWRQSQDKTPIEKIRRKSWSRTSYTDGNHGFAWVDKRFCAVEARLGLSVRIENNDGWRYLLFLHNQRREQLSSDAFPTAEAAALAGIEHAELLMADQFWQAADCEAQAEHWAAWRAERTAADLRDAIKFARMHGCEGIAAALEAGQIERRAAINEVNRHRSSQPIRHVGDPITACNN
jgi:hypothetical protein